MKNEYAVIFWTKRNTPIPEDYEVMSKRMVDLVSEMEGFLRIQSVSDGVGGGVSISYWSSLDAISRWKKNEEHQEAQRLGQEKWYKSYRVEICEVLKSYNSYKD